MKTNVEAAGMPQYARAKATSRWTIEALVAHCAKEPCGEIWKRSTVEVLNGGAFHDGGATVHILVTDRFTKREYEGWIGVTANGEVVKVDGFIRK